MSRASWKSPDGDWRRLSFRFRNLQQNPSVRAAFGGRFVGKQNHVRSFIKPTDHVVHSACLHPFVGVGSWRITARIPAVTVWSSAAIGLFSSFAVDESRRIY